MVLARRLDDYVLIGRDRRMAPFERGRSSGTADGTRFWRIGLAGWEEDGKC
jgi:hypothetical protein